ncbi:MAG: M48 family metallopeptidase [Chloroflexi bacterium]|nr:M48 family metallopeptidase [Chloroflexota bacterium]
MKQRRSGARGTRTLDTGGAVIHYELVYTRRKTLGIQVYPDARVVVRAPIGASEAVITEALRKRAAWIAKHQTRFVQNPPKAPVQRQYASGEMFRYLGRPYRLEVIRHSAEKVALDGEALIATVRDTADAERIAALLDRWFRQQAERVFAERLVVLQPHAAALGLPRSDRLTIRTMKTRWGSCSSKRRVTLNQRLIHVAPDLIDYVVAHELCHLKVLNHGPAFYALLERLMPDWRARRKELNRVEMSE